MATERHVSAKKNLEVAKRALGLLLGLAESVDIVPGKYEIEIKDIDHYYGSSVSRKDLKAMESRVKNAGNMLRMADAGYLPVFGVGAAYQMNDHKKPFGSEGDSWQMMAFLRWEIFDGTKREHERHKARYKMGEAEEYLSGMKKEIAFNIYDAYLGVGEARDGLSLARAALMSAEEGLRIVNVRYENSLSSMIELLDMQTGLDASRAGVVEKESAYKSAAADLWFQSGTILKELGLE
jgi:outer membrane protein TolC